MRILIANSAPAPIYEQIVRQIKAQIIAGDLREAEPLPSIRKLAQELQISVITTKRAYEELEREGFVATSPGRGSFVAEPNRELLREARLREVEAHLELAVDAAKAAGADRALVEEMLDLAWKGE